MAELFYLSQIRGSKLQNRVSAAAPPLQAETLSHGVVTMRCDITTCSSSHVSLLVSGSAQTCFDDQVSISTIMEHFLALSLYEKNHILPYDICSF